MLENELNNSKAGQSAQSTVQVFREHCYVPGIVLAAEATTANAVATLSQITCRHYMAVTISMLLQKTKKNSNQKLDLKMT